MAGVYAESGVSPAGRRGPVATVRRMMGLMTEPELSPRTTAQREYDTDPALRELLTRAEASPTIRRARRR